MSLEDVVGESEGIGDSGDFVGAADGEAEVPLPEAGMDAFGEAAALLLHGA